MSTTDLEPRPSRCAARPITNCPNGIVVRHGLDHRWPDTWIEQRLRKLLSKIGRRIALELGEIIQILAKDHPNLSTEFPQYTRQQNQRRPDWRPVLERVRDCQMRRLEAHHLKHGQP